MYVRPRLRRSPRSGLGHSQRAPRAPSVAPEVVLRYCDAHGAITSQANPNGSAHNIAGVRNAAGNVFGLMPHPERANDPLLGSADGRFLIESLVAAVRTPALV